jgi:hypothetical protein
MIGVLAKKLTLPPRPAQQNRMGAVLLWNSTNSNSR